VRLCKDRCLVLCFQRAVHSSSHQIVCFKVTEGLHPSFSRGCKVTSTELLTLLRCEFWAVFTRLRSAVCVATLYDFVVTLKHAVWCVEVEELGRQELLLTGFEPRTERIRSRFVVFHHIHGLVPMACSGLIVHRKTFWFPSSGSLLIFRVIKMSSWNSTNVSWSEMVTGLVSFGLPSLPSFVLTPEKGCPVRLQKCSAVVDFSRLPWARILHIYDPWRKGGPAIIKPPDTGFSVGPRILTWYSDRPNISVGIPHPPTGGRTQLDYRVPIRDSLLFWTKSFSIL
jgi:hypothetical protein